MFFCLHCLFKESIMCGGEFNDLDNLVWCGNQGALLFICCYMYVQVLSCNFAWQLHRALLHVQLRSHSGIVFILGCVVLVTSISECEIFGVGVGFK